MPRCSMCSILSRYTCYLDFDLNVFDLNIQTLKTVGEIKTSAVIDEPGQVSGGR